MEKAWRPSRSKAKRHRPSHKRGGPPGKKGPPPTPQCKITLRRIQGVDRFGNASGLVVLVRELVRKVNEKMDKKIVLDEGSVARAIEQEQLVWAARNAWEELQSGLDENNASMENKSAESDSNTTAPAVKKETAKGTKFGGAKISSNNSQLDATAMTMRLLYLIPCKQTRRSGEKPGCIYLVLIAPRIEAKSAAVPTPVPAVEGKDASTPPTTTASPPDYSLELAHSRNLLQKAVGMLQKLTDELRHSQELGGVQVQGNLNGKTFKPLDRPDRLEGTIWETPDYIEFCNLQKETAQALQARPKPVPGGGSASAQPSSEAPIAALVQHLQSKRWEEQQRKTVRKKGKTSHATTKEVVKAAAETKKKKRTKAVKKAAVAANTAKKPSRNALAAAS
jgi:hypothetical protein